MRGVVLVAFCVCELLNKDKGFVHKQSHTTTSSLDPRDPALGSRACESHRDCETLLVGPRHSERTHLERFQPLTVIRDNGVSVWALLTFSQGNVTGRV